MRDKNLTLIQLNIQLEKITSRMLEDDKFLTRPVFVTPTLQGNSELRIVYPRNYRLLRSLAIFQWYFPEEIHWQILLDLSEQNFNWLNDKQRIEINILLLSKENMLNYLIRTQRYSSEMFFGNIAKNDFQELLLNLKIYRKKLSKPKRTIRRRGYKDKGSRRPDHLWLPEFDFTLDEKQLYKEKKETIINKTIQRISEFLLRTSL